MPTVTRLRRGRPRSMITGAFTGTTQREPPCALIRPYCSPLGSPSRYPRVDRRLTRRRPQPTVASVQSFAPALGRSKASTPMPGKRSWCFAACRMPSHRSATVDGARRRRRRRGTARARPPSSVPRAGSSGQNRRPSTIGATSTAVRTACRSTSGPRRQLPMTRGRSWSGFTAEDTRAVWAARRSSMGPRWPARASCS